VGPDPSTSVIVSFASTDSSSPDPMVGGVLVGSSEDKLHRVVMEREPAQAYTAMQPPHLNYNYTSPYYHHVLIDGLDPDTVYSYKCVVRNSEGGFKHLEKIIAREIDENVDEEEAEEEVDEEEAEEAIVEVEEELTTEQKETAEEVDSLFMQSEYRPTEEENYQLDGPDDRKQRRRRQQQQAQLRRRRLAPPPYDSTQCRCPDPEAVRTFRTAPVPGGTPVDKHLKIALIGDIGQFEHSEETLDHLRTHHGPSVADVVLLAGDLAYPEYDHRRWDTFLDFLDDYPLVDQVPLQVTPGNHDIDKAEQDSQIFQAYETRFRMPRVAPPHIEPYSGEDSDDLLKMSDVPYPLVYDYGNAFYSFVYGQVHTIVLNSYTSMEKDSTQYKWLIEEFARVDRTVTPWLFVMFHVPIYNTFHIHQRDKQLVAARDNIEELLVDHHVNLVINGHVHAYMRSHPVAYAAHDPDGPVHVIMGAGGRDADAPYLNEEPEEWVAVRDASVYGYGLVEIFNATHLRFDWVHTGEGDHPNHVWDKVEEDEKEMPPGGVDAFILKNQHILATGRW